MARFDAATQQKTWAGRMRRFRKAGAPVKNFCKAEGVSLSSFYKWRRLLAAEKATDASFVAVALAPQWDAGCRLTLTGGATIELANASRQQLTDLLAAVVDATTAAEEAGQ